MSQKFLTELHEVAPNLTRWCYADLEEASRNYIRQQILALQVAAHLEPIEHYLSFSPNDKSVVDTRDCDTSCFASRSVNIKGAVTFRKGRAHIWFGENCRVKNLHINSDLVRCNIIIGPNTEIDDLAIQCGPGAAGVVIASGTTIPNGNFLLQERDGYVLIGDDCMFSTGVSARTTDSHGIYDTVSRQRVNQGRPIIVHRHVWVGREVTLGKGSEIGPNAIIGQGAFTSGLLKGGHIHVGQPARPLQGNRTWDRTQAETLDEAETVHPSRARQWNHIRTCEKIDAYGQQSLIGVSRLHAISRILASNFEDTIVSDFVEVLQSGGDTEGAALCAEAHAARRLAMTRQSELLVNS
jgi:acetyltransferase-like isoleucine patch superfamily enzyme